MERGGPQACCVVALHHGLPSTSSSRSVARAMTAECLSHRTLTVCMEVVAPLQDFVCTRKLSCLGKSCALLYCRRRSDVGALLAGSYAPISRNRISMPRRGAARWSRGRVLMLAAAGCWLASRGIVGSGSGSGSSFSSFNSCSRSGSGVGAGAGGGPGRGGSDSYGGLREWGGACSSGGGFGSGSSTGIIDVGTSSGSGSGSATVMKHEASTGSAGGGAAFLFAATRTLGNSSGAARRANQSPCGVMKPASRPRAVPKTNVCTLCVPRMPSIFACNEDSTLAAIYLSFRMVDCGTDEETDDKTNTMVLVPCMHSAFALRGISAT